MAINNKIKNPLILSIVSTIFLVPVAVLSMYLFNEVNWLILIVTIVIYFVVIFIVYLIYGNIAR